MPALLSALARKTARCAYPLKSAPAVTSVIPPRRLGVVRHARIADSQVPPQALWRDSEYHPALPSAAPPAKIDTVHRAGIAGVVDQGQYLVCVSVSRDASAHSARRCTPVQRTKGHRLRDMRFIDFIGLCKVGDGQGNAQNLVIATRTQAEFFQGMGE